MWALSGYLLDPAFGGFYAAHLDAGEGIVELGEHRAHILHAGRHADFLAMVDYLADGRDDGGRTAEAGFGKIGHFGKQHFTFFHFHAEVVLGDMEQGAAGDGRQDALALGSDELAVLGDEDEVGAAGLFHLGAGGGVEIHVFGIALTMSVHDGVEAHGVVEACLDVTGAVRSGAVEVGDADGDGLGTALEVGADGSDENTELVLFGGLHADDGGTAEHVGADVERSARAVGRHPGEVGLHGFDHGFDEALCGEHGHFKAAAGIFHALGVEVGAEGDHATVFRGVGFEAFEAGLAVLEHARTFGDDDFVVIGEYSFIPGAVLEIGHEAVVRLHVAEAEIGPIESFLFHETYLLHKKLKIRIQYPPARSLPFPCWEPRP